MPQSHSPQHILLHYGRNFQIWKILQTALNQEPQFALRGSLFSEKVKKVKSRGPILRVTSSEKSLRLLQALNTRR